MAAAPNAIVKRDANGRLLKGSAGLGGGRPKGLAASVRELLDVEEIVEFAIKILRGRPLRVGGDAGYDAVPSLQDMKWAAQFLADRGWGLPNVNVQISEAPEVERFNPEALSRGERDELERLLARAAGENIVDAEVVETEPGVSEPAQLASGEP